MVNTLERWYGWVKHTTIALDVLFLVVLLVNYLGYLPEFWNILYIFYFILTVNTGFLALRINKIPENERENNTWIYLTGHLFILILIVLGVNQFLQREIVNDYLPYIIGFAIASGFLTFYSHQNKVEKELEDEKEKEEAKEKKRKDEFSTKFKTLSKFNLPYGFAKVIRNKNDSLFNKILKLIILTIACPFIFLIRLPYSFTKWMYKEGWWYSVGLILIVGVMSIFYMTQIGNYYLWTDETFSFNAAKAIIETGKPILDSGLNYDRALIYHYLLAGSMFIFGVGEFGSRMINVIFSIFISIIIYATIKKESNKIFGLIGVFLFMTFILSFSMIIETRFYVMLSLLFLVASLLFYYTFIDKTKEKNDKKREKNIFSFNIKWAILFIVSLYLGYKTHPFMFIVFFGISSYLFYSLLINFKFDKRIILLILFISLILFGSYYLTGTLDLKYSYFEAGTPSWALNNERDTNYYTDILNDYLILFPVSLILLSLYLILKKKNIIVYLYFIAVLGVYFISNQRVLEIRYIFFLVPIIILLLTFSIYLIYVFILRNKMNQIISVSLVLFLLFSHAFILVNEINTDNCNKDICILFIKKIEFYKVMSYLENKNNPLIIADFHAAQTLYSYGFDVKYIIFSYEKTPYRLDYAKLENGTYYDLYTNIPLIDQNSTLYEEPLNTPGAIFVIRNENLLERKIELRKNISFSNPSLYENR